MKKTTLLVYMGLFIALDVILTRFLSIQLLTLRIGFGIIPIAFASIMFGPIIGGITGALGDIIGMLIFPKGAYFPGFTLSAFLGGVIYGLFLYKKPKSPSRIFLCLLTSTLFISLGLNTYWLTILTGKGFMAMLPQRIIKDALMLPINTILIHSSWKYIGEHIIVPSINKVKQA